MEITFKELECWVQVHKAPFNYHTEPTAKDLSVKIGNFKGFDKRDLTNKYMQIKVSLKVDKPLRPKLLLIRENLPNLKMLLIYKKISDFCYYCGVIGHEIKECESWFTNKSNGLPVDAIQERRGFGKQIKEKPSPRSS